MSYESDVKMLPALEAQLEQLEPELQTARADLKAVRQRGGSDEAELEALQQLISRQAQLESKRDAILERNPHLVRQDLKEKKRKSGDYRF